MSDKKYKVIKPNGDVIPNGYFDSIEEATEHISKLLKFAVAKYKGLDSMGVPNSYRDACQEIEELKIVDNL